MYHAEDPLLRILFLRFAHSGCLGSPRYANADHAAVGKLYIDIILFSDYNIKRKEEIK